MNELIPICCLCLKVRTDTPTDSGQGPWVQLKAYARELRLSFRQGLLFTHVYCPDCVAHCDEGLAADRPKSLKESPAEYESPSLGNV